VPPLIHPLACSGSLMGSLKGWVLPDSLTNHGSVGRHQVFEFLKPVEDDVDLVQNTDPRSENG
jgi:hypothetical protein